MMTEEDLFKHLDATEMRRRRRIALLFWGFLFLLAAIIVAHVLMAPVSAVGAFDPRSDDYATGECP